MTNTTTEHIVSGGHPPICPECSSGKHPNCAGTALDETVDEIVPCTCAHMLCISLPGRNDLFAT